MKADGTSVWNSFHLKSWTLVVLLVVSDLVPAFFDLCSGPSARAFEPQIRTTYANSACAYKDVGIHVSAQMFEN